MTTGDTKLRRGVESDAAALAQFAARAFAEAFGRDNRPEDMQAHLESSYGLAQQGKELSDANVATLLMERGTVLLAYAQVRRSVPPACITQQLPIELYRFYVDRPMQGTGVARSLMAAAFAATRQFGGQHLWLGVWERNPRAIAFYKKEGFVDVGSTFYMVGLDRQTDRVMLADVN